MSRDTRLERHALLELQALLTQLATLRDEGDPARFSDDSRYREVLHRLWIAAGNETLAYTQATGQPVRADQTWANLYDLRNHLAHSRLPDIDESLVRRFTWARPDSIQATVEHLLRSRPLVQTPVAALAFYASLVMKHAASPILNWALRP